MHKLIAFLLLISIATLASCGQSDNFSLIPVKIGEKWGYVDKTGSYIINPQFDDAFPFYGKLARVKQGSKYGFIDKKGQLQINPIYIDASDFSESLACVVEKDQYPKYINLDGEVAFVAEGFDIAGTFSEGLAPVRKGKKWGFIGKDGAVVIETRFSSTSIFSEGLAAVSLYDDEEGLYGYIDKKGILVIPSKYSAASVFSEGLAAVKIDDKYGYIDNKGKIVINPQFDYAMPFMNGTASVKLDDKMGLIDKSGKYLVNPQFEMLFNYGGQPMMCTIEDDSKIGFVEKKGKIVISPQFDDANPFLGDLAFVRKDGLWGAIDVKGEFVINPQFKLVRFPNLGPVFAEYYANENLISSDFFEATNVSTALFDNGKLFGKHSHKMTLRLIAETFSNVQEHSTTQVIAKGIALSDDHFNIENLIFGFDSKIYSYQNTGGWYYYNTEKVYNVALQNSTYSFDIALRGKADGKSKKVFKALNKHFSSNGGKIEEETNTSFWAITDQGGFFFNMVSDDRISVKFSTARKKAS